MDIFFSTTQVTLFRLAVWPTKMTGKLGKGAQVVVGFFMLTGGGGSSGQRRHSKRKGLNPWDTSEPWLAVGFNSSIQRVLWPEEKWADWLIVLSRCAPGVLTAQLYPRRLAERKNNYCTDSEDPSLTLGILAFCLMYY